MAWTTIEANTADIAGKIATFEGTVTSIDDFSMTSIGTNRVVAVIEYSE